jgi:regulatory protein
VRGYGLFVAAKQRLCKQKFAQPLVFFRLEVMAGTITALKVQAKAKDRVNVSLDGEFAFGLALIHALWLKIGQHLSDAEIAELQVADTLEKAQQRALNLISYRPRSVKEVQQRLKKAGVDEAQTETIVTRLKEAGLLDDETFSNQWVESRLRASPRSKRMIQWELKQKGVGADQINKALEGVNDEDAAYQAVLKKLPRFAALDARERKRKLMEFLARNGFDYDVISSVVTKVLNEESED